MTPINEADQQSGFLVANLYTKSKFEEDCLINLSIEKTSTAEGGKISGLIRVRAKTEGMALCIGEKCKQIKWSLSWSGHLTFDKFIIYELSKEF